MIGSVPGPQDCGHEEAFVIHKSPIVLRAFLAGAVLSAAMGSSAASAGPGFGAILDLCEATSLEEATSRGERLGWPVAPEDRDWRLGFERHNGGTVRVVGWRRGAREGDGLLSYWLASGSDAHTACALSTDDPGLLAVLRERYGTPDTFEEQGGIVSAVWRRGGREVPFTRVGASSSLTLSRRD